VLAACDRLVELGPAGGERGGRVIAVGTPDELALDPESITGPWLELQRAGHVKPNGRGRAAAPRRRREAVP